MSRRNVPWAVGFGLVAALLFGGCGDDGGSDPSVVVCDVDGVHVDMSYVTLVLYEMGLTAVAGSTADSESIYIYFLGNGTGTWESPGGGGMIMYKDAEASTYQADDTIGSYTITVTTYGPEGGLIEGTFLATVEDVSGLETHTVSGSFSVINNPIDIEW